MRSSEGRQLAGDSKVKAFEKRSRNKRVRRKVMAKSKRFGRNNRGSHDSNLDRSCSQSRTNAGLNLVVKILWALATIIWRIIFVIAMGFILARMGLESPFQSAMALITLLIFEQRK